LRLLLPAADEMAIGAELFCQVLAVHRVRFAKSLQLGRAAHKAAARAHNESR
jgi:hypothetical protein